MHIDLNHLHYWMQAIRQSPDPMRTLDAFWSGQLHSKEWLIQELRKHKNKTKMWPSVDIHGGWVGVLASMLFQSDMYLDKIRSVDLDPTVRDTAILMNKNEEIEGRFTALTADMCEISSDYDIIINTSCEHISQPQYDHWASKQNPKALLILQSNNYVIDEHVRIANSLDEFVDQSQINVAWKGQLELPLYTRYMIIGNLK